MSGRVRGRLGFFLKIMLRFKGSKDQTSPRGILTSWTRCQTLASLWGYPGTRDTLLKGLTFCGQDGPVGCQVWGGAYGPRLGDNNSFLPKETSASIGAM